MVHKVWNALKLVAAVGKFILAGEADNSRLA